MQDRKLSLSTHFPKLSKQYFDVKVTKSIRQTPISEQGMIACQAQKQQPEDKHKNTMTNFPFPETMTMEIVVLKKKMQLYP